MTEHATGQPGPDRAVGRPGPAARMSEPAIRPERPRSNVLITPVSSSRASVATQAPPVAPPTAPPTSPAPAPAASPSAGRAAPSALPPTAGQNGHSAPQPARSEQPKPPKGRKSRRAAKKAEPAPRSARLFVTHVDPWSVMKQAFLLGLALAIIILVAFGALWFALDSAGVLDAITRTATDVGGESGASVTSFLEFGRVMGAGLIIAGIETVLVTALATLFAFLYNLAVHIGGGLEVTLSESDY